MGQSLVFDGTKWNGTFWRAVKPPSFEDSGLELYAKLDERSGTIAWDLSGKNRHGTAFNGVQWVPGKYGGCATFNGTNQFINFGNVLTNATYLNYSFMLWVNIKSFTNVPNGETLPILSNWNIWSPSNQKGFLFRFLRNDPTGHYFTHIICNGSSYAHLPTFHPSQPLSVLDTLYANRWLHICGVFRGGSVGELYIDGSRINIATNFALGSMVPDMMGTTWIARSGINLRNSDIRIDEVKIFSRALGTTEIVNDFLRGYDNTFTLSNQWASRLLENVARAKGLGGVATVMRNQPLTINFPPGYFSQIPIINVCQEYTWGNSQTLLGDRSSRWIRTALNPDDKILYNLNAENINVFTEYMQTPPGLYIRNITPQSFVIDLELNHEGCSVGWHAFGI